MNENNKLAYILCFLRNTISLICFTILAIIFKHWWIVFFAIIFFCYVDMEDKEDE